MQIDGLLTHYHAFIVLYCSNYGSSITSILFGTYYDKFVLLMLSLVLITGICALWGEMENSGSWL